MASHTRRLKKGGSHSKSHKGRKGHKGHKGGMVHRKSRHTRGKKRGGYNAGGLNWLKGQTYDSA